MSFCLSAKRWWYRTCSRGLLCLLYFIQIYVQIQNAPTITIVVDVSIQLNTRLCDNINTHFPFLPTWRNEYKRAMRWQTKWKKRHQKDEDPFKRRWEWNKRHWTRFVFSFFFGHSLMRRRKSRIKIVRSNTIKSVFDRIQKHIRMNMNSTLGFQINVKRR